MTVVIGVAAFLAGIGVGFILRWLLVNRRSYSGTMYVIQEEDKTLYSLEVDGDLENLKSADRVIFKVDTSAQNSNRK